MKGCHSATTASNTAMTSSAGSLESPCLCSTVSKATILSFLCHLCCIHTLPKHHRCSAEPYSWKYYSEGRNSLRLKAKKTSFMKSSYEGNPRFIHYFVPLLIIAHFPLLNSLFIEVSKNKYERSLHSIRKETENSKQWAICIRYGILPVCM